MAKTRKFKSNTGYPVHVRIPTRPDSIEVPYYAPHYETNDVFEIDALVSSPEVIEIEDKKGGKGK